MWGRSVRVVGLVWKILVGAGGLTVMNIFFLIASTAFQFGFFEGFTVDQKRMWEC